MPYYSELGLYSGPSTSSYIPLYLPGPYSNHSSILSNNFSRPPPTYIKSPRGYRNYKPHLTTISERRTDSPLRLINSPIVSYSPVIIPKPIKINTADIDLSINKYRKYDRQRKKPESINEGKQDQKSPSPSRTIESPRSSLELKDATPSGNIKRERATVRIKTIHKDHVMNPRTYRKWRDNFEPDELYPDEVESPKTMKKTPGELLKEKFLISENQEDPPKMKEKKIERRKSVKAKQAVVKTPSFHDICTAITSNTIDEELNPGQPVEVQRRQSRQFSTEDILKEFRRTSVELSDSEKNVIDTIINKVEAEKAKLEKDYDSRGSIKKRRKYVKSSSARLTLDSTEEDISKQPTLQRRPTLRKISRTRSSNLDLDEVQKRLNSTEESNNKNNLKLDTPENQSKPSLNKKPVITATVNVEEKPILKAVIDDILIEESPSPKQKKGGKLKFNFTVEEIQQNEDSKLKGKVPAKLIANCEIDVNGSDVTKPKIESDVKKNTEVKSKGEADSKKINEVLRKTGMPVNNSVEVESKTLKSDEVGSKKVEDTSRSQGKTELNSETKKELDESVVSEKINGKFIQVENKSDPTPKKIFENQKKLENIEDKSKIKPAVKLNDTKLTTSNKSISVVNNDSKIRKLKPEPDQSEVQKKIIADKPSKVEVKLEIFEVKDATSKIKPQKTDFMNIEVPPKKKPVVSKIIKKKHSARIGLILEEIKESPSEGRSSSQEKGPKQQLILRQEHQGDTNQENKEKIKIEETNAEIMKIKSKTQSINAINDNKTSAAKNNVGLKSTKHNSEVQKTSSDPGIKEINNNTIQRSESNQDFWQVIGRKESVKIPMVKKLETTKPSGTIAPTEIKESKQSAPIVLTEQIRKSDEKKQLTKKFEDKSKRFGVAEEEKSKTDSKKISVRTSVSQEFSIEESKEKTQTIKLELKSEEKTKPVTELISECQVKKVVVKKLEPTNIISKPPGDIGPTEIKESTQSAPIVLTDQIRKSQEKKPLMKKIEEKSKKIGVGEEEKIKSDSKKISVQKIETPVSQEFSLEESKEKTQTIKIELKSEERTETVTEQLSEAQMKKIISKRSLVQKAKKDDPDLEVFEPPPEPKEKEKQEEKKEKFIPLQSNRLSQFMHPFKKPEQFEACPVEIYARPKTIRKRHVPRGRFGQWVHYRPDSSSEEESDDSSDSDEDSSSEEEENNTGRVGVNYGASTSSNDSGFDSGAAKNKDKGSTSDTRDSPSSNPATNPAFAIDPNEEECCKSSTYQGFQRSGRITPPATTIPRFRKYCVEDFNFLKVLGKGSFGKVLLAELKDTEYYYAIKCLKKDVVLEDDDVECTLIERKVLALGTKHPYLCHLLCTFQTNSHLFFVMEYLNGGDLMFHIQQSGRFSEERARFYAAEIVSGLKFLHNKGIVYRDLKLDNILLDFDGHVRIADFGMCKLQVFLDRMADTFCGTPDYMAPEIIRGQHYNQSVDWWSFGVLLYEMLLAQSPFSGCDEDELFWSICNEKPVLPRFLSPESSRILSMLLEKDATKRLGNRFSPCGDIKDQPFFKSIDWDQLEARLLEPPFKPNLSHPLDTKYFDKHFTTEQAKLTPIEHHILESIDQTQFQGFSYTNPNATDK